MKESKRVDKVPSRELHARSVALAGSLLALMRRFLDNGAKEDPREIDRLFHRMVWEGMR